MLFFFKAADDIINNGWLLIESPVIYCVRSSVLLDVHIQLREWEVDSVLREFVVDFLGSVEVYTPIIRRFNPETHCKLDAAALQGTECDERFSRLAEDSCIFLDD